MAETRPDPDRIVDREAIDEHARKLVAEKVLRDRAKFDQLQRKPLSPTELLGVILAAAAVILVLMLALAAQK